MAAKPKEDAPAAPEGAAQRPAGKSRESIVQAIGAFAVLTLVGAGSGTMLGFHLVGSVESAMKVKAAAQNRSPKPEPRYATGTSMQSVPPVVTNLAAPQKVWVRLEASIILADEEVANPGVLAAEIAEDIMAYLRTLTLEQLEGPSGLMHLHEDLNERVAIRSNDRVRELVIEQLVVQ